jgi:hypothetical protein
MHARLADRIDNVPDSPVMSPDFLVGYLGFGPTRDVVARNVNRVLPLALEKKVAEFAPKDLFDLAEELRIDAKDMPERVIRRRVRDSLDAARRREGAKAKLGSGGMERDLAEAIDKHGL